ncbi:hypothetical protein SETIT_2G062300v2 [Setaria italica]|uniref:Nucleolar protein 58/56 N-terminal domain-containing protein n=1 Tax=Setaria italica TaxID=4555 RepID=A0A368PWE2_SETIT|nr:probable nucleolar protein 5-1 [Setaria italica]RCV09844.1 hypothetical protein SETIT_2G062300v2 [Setaria italica]
MPSESDESKLVEDLEMQDSSGEEDAPRRYNSDGEVLPPGQLLDDMAVKVLFETPSGFAIFRYNGYKLRHQVALMKEIWADFADPDSAAHEVRLLGFKTFQNKVHAISQSTGVSNELAKMIRNNLQPRQRLAVGNEDYKSIIEKELGIRCVYDSAVAELMWGLKIQMQSLLTPENSDLSNEGYFPMSTGMYCFLKGQKFDVKPDMMVTRRAIELAFLIYACDRHVNKRRSTLRSVAAHIAKISRINTEGWDFHKIAVALKIYVALKKTLPLPIRGFQQDIGGRLSLMHQSTKSCSSRGLPCYSMMKCTITVILGLRRVKS